ncbi:MAG: bifunctional glutamate N-acetyltransferase/amino-acid acetyltransferase ArgJ [Dehalococcoidia bacterium]|nr:bifunctional glutamate N-acetyltransferase/amino-acid acetyltransferase ArgJ [Dehalococcoidia bacterium]
MNKNLNWLENGTVTSPKKFLAGATYSGIRTYAEDKLDLGILYSETPCTVAGTFTKNQIRSLSVVLDQKRVSTGRSQALIVNSGIANACVGEQGMTDAIEMASLAAAHLGIDQELVLASSTGLIGVELPMALIRSGVTKIKVEPDGGQALARAIKTTDRVSKEFAVEFQIGGNSYILGGIAKGSGMIHPDMATMLAFLSTDAPVNAHFLQKTLSESVAGSFNMIDVDGDTSTNDSVIIFSNGAGGGEEINDDSRDSDVFAEALNEICIALAKEIAKDGEGASKLIEVTVEGASNTDDAILGAKSIAASTLVKSAIHGEDPNWGRIMVALGYSGAKVEESLVSLYINNVCLMESGIPIPFFKDAVSLTMAEDEVAIKVELNLGESSATAWGCDISEEYVSFNSEYTT